MIHVTSGYTPLWCSKPRSEFKFLPSARGDVVFGSTRPLTDGSDSPPPPIAPSQPTCNLVPLWYIWLVCSVLSGRYGLDPSLRSYKERQTQQWLHVQVDLPQ
jgi:hypothetical protein